MSSMETSRPSRRKLSDVKGPEVSQMRAERGPLILKRSGLFSRFARRTAWATGKPITFGLAVAVVAAWAVTGPYFGYSNTWQLVINTGTTIITFLMVFLIQNTQNHDAQAVQLKLDELIRATDRAHTALIDLEELTDEDLEKIRARFLALAKTGRDRLLGGDSDTGTPELDPN